MVAGFNRVASRVSFIPQNKMSLVRNNSVRFIPSSDAPPLDSPAIRMEEIGSNRREVRRVRLVVAINYAHQIVFIKWIGSHADYDKIDVKMVNYGDQAD